LPHVEGAATVAPRGGVRAVDRFGGLGQAGVGAGHDDGAGRRAGRKDGDARRVELAIGGRRAGVRNKVIIVLHVVVHVGRVDLRKRRDGLGFEFLREGRARRLSRPARPLPHLVVKVIEPGLVVACAGVGGRAA
jgi:hypothetical protein